MRTPPRRRRPHGRLPRRAVTAVTAVTAVSILASGCGSAVRRSVRPAVPVSPAAAFLGGYVRPDGRVVRVDQGGDTVSEGQAYAMLLDVATGNRAQFARVWDWSRSSLGQPDGLLAYHWSSGRVADRNAASDADLDVARALVLAGKRWHDPAFAAAGRTYAAAILTNETVTAGGTLWLVAGPWARTSPSYIDPSYFDPATFALLATATGDGRWDRIATSATDALVADTSGGTKLPSDWATVTSSGTVQASAPPGGGPTLYGYDAFRTLVRSDDGCADGVPRHLDARILPLARKTAAATNRADDYNTDATASRSGDNPLMLVAAAGAAAAAGDVHDRDGYLRAAGDAETIHPSYYLDAWVALGHYLLTTSALAGCNP